LEVSMVCRILCKLTLMLLFTGVDHTDGVMLNGNRSAHSQRFSRAKSHDRALITHNGDEHKQQMKQSNYHTISATLTSQSGSVPSIPASTTNIHDMDTSISRPIVTGYRSRSQGPDGTKQRHLANGELHFLSSALRCPLCQRCVPGEHPFI
jgi:hypothetical protein